VSTNSRGQHQRDKQFSKTNEHVEDFHFFVIQSQG
jgi:hypothetical protein